MAEKRELPPPFNHSDQVFDLVAQGAESLLYRTTSILSVDQQVALKVRPEKKWRHPTLDKRLTRARVLAEARVLLKLSKELRVMDEDGEHSCVPSVIGLDWENGWLATEWVEGTTVKEAIRSWEKHTANKGKDKVGLLRLLKKIGIVIGKMHACGVIHGDLTTSNLMLRPRSPNSANIAGSTLQETDGAGSSIVDGSIILIDFGLATQSVSDEDRAVDLYVLERAFGSTHPRQESVFGEVLKSYGEAMGKGGKVVLRKLEDVRMRGRKKSMLG